jgi:hypothetical protein
VDVSSDFINNDAFVGDAPEGSIQACEKLEHGFVIATHQCQ